MKIGIERLVPLFVFACGTIHADNVVTDWNTIASTTIVTNGGKKPAASAVWLPFSSLAVYDAVNAITGQYQPFCYRIAAPADASTAACSDKTAGETAARAIAVDSKAFTDDLLANTLSQTHGPGSMPVSISTTRWKRGGNSASG